MLHPGWEKEGLIKIKGVNAEEGGVVVVVEEEEDMCVVLGLWGEEQSLFVFNDTVGGHRTPAVELGLSSVEGVLALWSSGRGGIEFEVRTFARNPKFRTLPSKVTRGLHPTFSVSLGPPAVSVVA